MKYRAKSFESAAVSFACAVLFAFSFLLRVQAGPPLLTDDPDTPGPNHWEINIGTVSTEAGHQWELGLPLWDINYGVGEHLQLKYQGQVNELFPDHGGAKIGAGNSLAGVKWRFLDQTNNSWLEISVYPQLEFSDPAVLESKGLAEPGNNLLLPIEIEHQFESTTVYGEVGYIRNEHVPTAAWYGVAAEHELGKTFAVMGELYGGFDRDFRNNGLLFDLGFRQVLTEHAALIASAGRGIFGSAERAPAFLSYLAAQLTF